MHYKLSYNGYIRYNHNSRLYITIIAIIISFLAIHAKPCFSDDSINPGLSAYFKGRIWYFNNSTKQCKGDDCEYITTIASKNIFGNSDNSKKTFTFKTPDPQFGMISDSDHLWIVNSEYTGVFDGDNYSQTKNEEPLFISSKPFFYKSFPSVIERQGKVMSIKSYKNNIWEEVDTFYLNSTDPRYNRIKALETDGMLHLFISYKGAVFHYSGLTDIENADYLKWEKVSDNASTFSIGTIDDKPSVLLNNKSSFLCLINGYQLNNGVWKNIYTSPESPCGPDKNTAFQQVNINSYVLCFNTFMNAKCLLVENNKTVSSIPLELFSISASILLVMIPLIVMIIHMTVLYVWDPFWPYKYSIPLFSETRIFPSTKTTIKEIMSCDFSKVKHSKIKKRQKHNAITISGLLNSQGASGRINIVQLEESQGKIKITLFSKFDLVISIVIFAMMMGFEYIFYRALGVTFRPERTLIYFCILSSIIPLTIILLTFILKRQTKKSSNELFDKLLVYIGLEDEIDAKLYF